MSYSNDDVAERDQLLRERSDTQKLQQAMHDRIAEGCAGQGISGVAAATSACLGRLTLRERVKIQMECARGEAIRERRLSELADLLDKNPDFARILDLVDLVR